MSSSLSAESTPLGSRAVLSLSVFASMGLGNISASITFLVLLKAFQSGVESNIHHVEWVWRLFLGLGMIPAAITLYARWTMAETAPYEKCMSYFYQTMAVRESQLARCIKGRGGRTGREARPKRAVSGLCCLLQRMETCQGSICNLSILVPLVSANPRALEMSTDKWRFPVILLTMESTSTKVSFSSKSVTPVARPHGQLFAILQSGTSLSRLL